MSKLRSHPKAFTLIELLVVISIIALLVGILLPVLRNARQSAREMKCLTQIRSYAQGAFSYQADHGNLPPVARYVNSGNVPGKPTWLRFMAEDGYLGSDIGASYQQCPIVASDWFFYMEAQGFDPENGAASYSMNGWIGGYKDPSGPITLVFDSVTGAMVYFPDPLSSDDIADTSNTAYIVERYFPWSFEEQRLGAIAREWSDSGIPHVYEELSGNPWAIRGFPVQPRKGTSNMGFPDGSARAERGEHPSGQPNNRLLADGSNWENGELVLNFLDDN